MAVSETTCRPPRPANDAERAGGERRTGWRDRRVVGPTAPGRNRQTPPVAPSLRRQPRFFTCPSGVAMLQGRDS